ncbi:sensor histidine kinase [Fodinibius sp. AD559]|uniref:sensor histidine kinase n=1 Tax=Fodinibius sp. AD559 TaxID=3424179 RepID=UPI004046C972
MTIKSRLNIIALLAIGAFFILFAFLFYTTVQINNQLDTLERVNSFAKTASELNIITEQYLAYKETRYLDTWNNLYEELQEASTEMKDFPNRKVVSNSLPAIKRAFALIRKVKDNPEYYQNSENQEILLERARARIRSDIQLLLSISNRLEESRRKQIRDLQNDQRFELFILIPIIGFIVYLIVGVRKRIINSLTSLLEGTQLIGEGNLGSRIAIEGTDEHSQLADEFNAMAQKLSDHIKKEKQLREKAEENQKRWATLVEQDPSLIVIHIEGEVQFINSGGVDIIGAQSSEELIGKSIFQFIEEAQIDQAIDQVKEVQEEGKKTPPTVYKVKRLDGGHRYLQVQAMPIKYEEEQAVQLVGIDITGYVTYEEELQESLEEKSVLLQEIHHRVKNNLAIISGMMELQAMESTNETLRNKLSDSQLRIQSMALVHELLYESDNFSKLNFKEHVNQLVETIVQTINTETSVKVDYELENVMLNINQAVPCALIINELITNALKHAFVNVKKGKISISLKERDEMVYLNISDNGVGLPENISFSNANTLGMRIVQSLVQQLEASMDVTSGDKGTKLSITFKNTQVKGIGGHHLN